MAERREGDALAPCCCFPWRELVRDCADALRRPAPPEVIMGRTTCLCGQTIERFGCGHSGHQLEEASMQPPSCMICLPGGRLREREEKPPSPVCSSADAPGQEEPLVLLPPPPSRFVRARARQCQDQASSSSSVQDSRVRERSSSPPPSFSLVHAPAEQSQDPSASVQDSEVQERSSSSPPPSRFVHARVEQGQDQPPSSNSVQDSEMQERLLPPLPS
ncbi:hypothetical protein E2562_010934 [Oryza meyeriana var. granulata]|uniref:Uncharacterized protein n=1 Tax=Oryza meyeriana var. granulata TaxID=110450 RepID=A0A6G1BUZ1_9ORYZ|nr:hypothetical protein E2562_010934 [Oryza meyeriana var. granulata]